MKKQIYTLVLLTYTSLSAGWMDVVTDAVKTVDTTKSSSSKSSSLQDKAIKEALKQGVSFAVKSLSVKDSYLNDKDVKILLPKSVEKMEPYIRKMGGDEVVNNLILSMNSAATEAAPKTAEIFYKSIKGMSIKDAQKILSSESNALTQYFKDNSYKDLEVLIEPIVKKMMDKNEVSAYYKQVREYYDENSGSIPYKDSLAGFGTSMGINDYIPPKDLNSYVTKKSIDGLLFKIAQEEKNIRDNPLVQKSKIIRDVFGAL